MAKENQLIDSLSSTDIQPLLEVKNISKRFPGVVALDDVSVQFYPGEIHAVVGENGAGKSTLMKIMSGAYIPDSGDIVLDGKKVSFNHPKQAQLQGVSIIYQEFNLLPERTVAQNIFLGREPSKFGVIDFQKMNQDATNLLKQIGTEKMFSANAQLNTLSVAEQQIVEIAKAISFESKVLIMDEPTAALTVTEVQLLLNLVNKLKSQGMAIIFISHRLKEVLDFSERITVLKDGSLVKSVKNVDLTAHDIVSMMVGRALDHYFPPLGTEAEFGEVVLKVKNASNNVLHDINLNLRAGEVVGVAGLQGSGRTELAQALFGVNPFTSGEIELFGKPVKLNKPANAIQMKIGFVTEDRKSEGIFSNQSVRDNILLTIRTLLSYTHQIYKNGIKRNSKLVSTMASQVNVVVPGFGQEIQYLSGGNQQKVVLAKWLASDAKVFLLDEPTRGIDVEAKASVHDIVRGLTKKGAAVLMISSELPEILGMSDRILVMSERTIAGELPAKSSETDIMLVATGHSISNQKSQNNNNVSPAAKKE